MISREDGGYDKGLLEKWQDSSTLVIVAELIELIKSNPYRYLSILFLSITVRIK